MLRVVCDTNVLISAFIFPGGNCDKIIQSCRQGGVKLIISPQILEEFQRVLRLKFNYQSPEIKEFVDRIAYIATVVIPKEKISLIKEKDSDNRILECAVAGQADLIVTGDTKHLQPIGKYKGIKIIKPQEFLS